LIENIRQFNTNKDMFDSFYCIIF